MKILKKILFTIISIFLILILTYNIYNFVCVSVLKKDVSTIGGYGLLEVVSGSMEPTIHVGDIIIVDTKNNKYEVDDIITFYDSEGNFVTHRIKSIENDKIITQGDNNDSEDKPISTADIVGKYQFKINGGGKLLGALKSPFTMIMIFIIGILFCAFVSTDKDGNPIIDEEEQEYQEFKKYLKEKKKSKKENVSKLDDE